jgi:hypothetical protein
MNCQACGRDLAKYDEYRVACKAGHIWTLPEHADKPFTPGPGVSGSKPMVRLVKASRFPAWLPGAVLGGLALVVEVVSQLV